MTQAVSRVEQWWSGTGSNRRPSAHEGLVFPITQAFVEDVVLVDDDAIRGAQRTLWQAARIAAEPAAAVGIAALLTGARKPAPGERVAVIISGANMTAVQLDG